MQGMLFSRKQSQKMKNVILLLLTIFASQGFAQNKTDVSLFMKKDKNIYLTEVESKSGNKFHKVGHHGPAIENQWFGLRIYFNKSGAIDVYSKANPGLELREKRWYPSKKDQMNGWGADYYKVGKTVGLGGISLWDGEKVIQLNPVSKRTVKVFRNEDNATMTLLSEGIQYKDKKVDILVRVTVYSDKREAKVEAISQTGEPVQFVTGINYHKNTEVFKADNFIATWGIHPEDVAAEKIEVGAAIIFNNHDFEKLMDDGKQHLLISKPAKSLETWISSANEREVEINNFKKFNDYLNNR
jgi:hypothetical protein